MELIDKLQGRIAAQQATIEAMQARINELSAQLGLAPLDVTKAEPAKYSAAAAAPVVESPAPAAAPAAPVPAAPAQAETELFADQPLVIDGTAAFETDFVNEIPNCYRLSINGSRGTFTLNEDPQFYEMLAFGLADMVIPVADYTVDQLPNGNGGFNMADLTQCSLVNVAPGEMLLDGQFWKVTKKAQVQFKLK